MPLKAKNPSSTREARFQKDARQDAGAVAGGKLQPPRSKAACKDQRMGKAQLLAQGGRSPPGGQKEATGRRRGNPKRYSRELVVDSGEISPSSTPPEKKLGDGFIEVIARIGCGVDAVVKTSEEKGTDLLERGSPEKGLSLALSRSVVKPGKVVATL